MTAQPPSRVVVLGAPRSGTTLLRRLLAAHDDICCPSETNLLVAAGRFLAESAAAGGASVGVRSGLAFSGFSEQDVCRRLRAFVFSFLDELAIGAGCSMWAEKTAFSSFYVDQIESLCGDDVQYLLLCRHPLDCVSSQKELADKMEMFLPELNEFVQRYDAPHVGLAHGWTHVNRQMLDLAARRPGQCLQVRYEDLVTSASDTLECIFEFLDRPTDVDALRDRAFAGTHDVGLGDWKTYQTRDVHASSVGRWQGLSFETLRRVVPVVRELGEALGYSLVDVGEAQSADEARRRFQLGLMVAQMRAGPDGAVE